MTSSSRGKFDLKINKNLKKKRFFAWVPQVQRICSHYSYTLIMYGKGLTLMKIWSQLDHFCKKLGDQKCEKWQKNVVFFKFVFK